MAKPEQEILDYKRNFNKEKYARIGLYLLPEQKRQWESAAKGKGINLSQFIKSCVMEHLEGAEPE